MGQPLVGYMITALLTYFAGKFFPVQAFCQTLLSSVLSFSFLLLLCLVAVVALSPFREELVIDPLSLCHGRIQVQFSSIVLFLFLCVSVSFKKKKKILFVFWVGWFGWF